MSIQALIGLALTISIFLGVLAVGMRVAPGICSTSGAGRHGLRVPCSP
jgi:hypothetical protein